MTGSISSVFMLLLQFRHDGSEGGKENLAPQKNVKVFKMLLHLTKAARAAVQRINSMWETACEPNELRWDRLNISGMTSLH